MKTNQSNHKIKVDAIPCQTSYIDITRQQENPNKSKTRPGPHNVETSMVWCLLFKMVWYLLFKHKSMVWYLLFKHKSIVWCLLFKHKIMVWRLLFKHQTGGRGRGRGLMGLYFPIRLSEKT